MAQSGKKTSLRIIDCKPVYHGTNAKGDDYTIHEVRAAKPDGEMVNEKLRSFTALPVGQNVEVTVVPYTSEQYGKSFTLYPTSAKSAGTTAQVNELSEMIEQLRGMVAQHETRINELEVRLGEVMRDDKKVAASQAGDPGAVSDLDAKFGADPPFD